MENCLYGNSQTENAWCPGCGNHSLLAALTKALENLGRPNHQVLIVGGIGQAAKTPQYLMANGFCGLHGRALPPAAAAKIVNPGLTVIVDTGDGDSYGEGGNHFLHNIRRNPDISHFVHNNQIYALTKGQASPTTGLDQITDFQPLGVKNTPLNPLLLALVLGCGFVARGFTGDSAQLTEIITAAIKFRGYALVDILQPCVSFNKLNTHQWYAQRVKKLDSSHDPADLQAAMSRAEEWGETIPTGILYQVEKPIFGDGLSYLQDGPPLLERLPETRLLEKFMQELI